MSAPEPTATLDPALLHDLGLAELVPERYAAYRPLLAEGLAFFLQRLPPPRLAAIVAGQLALADDAGPAERVVALLHHCPTLHKLGQVVARDRRLHPELRRRLQTLESLPPSLDGAAFAALLARELPPGAALEPAGEPLAEASVAVVAPLLCRLNGRPREAVAKLLKPGVEAKLAEELALWPALGDYLEARSRRHGLPVPDYRNTLDNVARLLAGEVRLDREQAHLREAARHHARQPGVLIPRLLPGCTPRLTVMERVRGVPVTDPGLSRARRLRLAGQVAETLLARPFWSAGDGVFHADPHAGNLFASDDGRLAVLDWSLVARLDKPTRERVVGAVLAALSLDASRLRRELAGLCGLEADDPLLGAAVERALRRVRDGVFPGFDWLLALLDGVAMASRVSFPEDLVLFRKALLTLSGVLADLAGPQVAERVLMTAGLRCLLEELPARALARAGDRAFGTHVSNAELWSLWAGSGLTATRFWLGRWQDTLAGLVPAPGDPGGDG